ncbi:MAG: ABC transporter substrate-binding protein, partial [Cryobacterium sp.]
MRHTPTRLAALTGLVGVSILLTACTSAPAAEVGEPIEGGTLTYASGDSEPTCLDPHVGGNYPQGMLSTQYMESLVSRNDQGQIVPWLATSWEEDTDGLGWEFTLRDDVSFTDGTAFTAEAVQENVAHLQDPNTGSSTGFLALGKVIDTEAVSDTVVRLELREPDSALLESLSQPWLGMQSPTALERGQDENCLAPVGTGPFIVDNWVKQNAVSLLRNDDYTSPPADAAHDGPAYLDSVVWRFIPESATRYAALQAG